MFEDSLMVNSSFSCYMLMICGLLDKMQTVIWKLQRKLSNTFDRKDLGTSKHISMMEILQDKNEGKL